jgi:hypothetical protein
MAQWEIHWPDAEIVLCKTKYKGESHEAKDSARIQKSRAVVVNFGSNGMDHRILKRKIERPPLSMQSLSLQIEINMLSQLENGEGQGISP